MEVVEIKNHTPVKIVRDLVKKTGTEWEKSLSPEEFDVTSKKGTEAAFTGRYWNLHDKGIYECVGCGNHLFSSESKFESGTGWPSFWQPVAPQNIKTEDDFSYFTHRTEALCPLAAPISVMCLRTVPNPPDCVIA